MKIYVTESGGVSLVFGEGDIVDFADERFKQLYTHLREVYQKSLERKKKEPLPF